MTAREKHEWKALAPLAKEINVRLEKANIRDGEAQDHRLAAALKLAEAKKMCDERKLKFSPWCEANVDHSPTQLQALLKIGRSSDPVLAIADFRTQTNKQNKKSRKRQLAKATIEGVVDKTPQQVIEVAMAALSDEERAVVVRQYAEELGLVVVDAAASPDSADTFAYASLPKPETIEKPPVPGDVIVPHLQSGLLR